MMKYENINIFSDIHNQHTLLLQPDLYDGTPRQFAAPRASFNDIISIGELIKSVKEGNVGIKKIAEKSGYAFRGRYHDPELNDFYYEDVYYKNCMVAADGSPIKYGKGWQCLLFHLLHQIDVG